MASSKVIYAMIHDCVPFFIAARKIGIRGKKLSLNEEQSSSSSKIPIIETSQILQRLKDKGGNQDKTRSNYHRIWKSFNQFLVKLDKWPKFWEDRVSLFIANLIQNGAQSATVKSYVLAIKSQLIADNYKWDDGKLMLHTLTWPCRMRNDVVCTRLPIHCGFLEMILFEVERIYHTQPYLVIMFQSLFSVAYYGLFRIGELTLSDHTVRAKDLHLAFNKKKQMMILYSSKPHDKESRPQKIKIEVIHRDKRLTGYAERFFCPFRMMHNYIKIRGNYESNQEIFFIFRKGEFPVKPQHARNVLEKCIYNLRLDYALYSFHSFRIGRSSDMKKYGYSIEEIQHCGCWKSNAVYKYLRD